MHNHLISYSQSRRQVIKGIAGLTLAWGLTACGAQTRSATESASATPTATPTPLPPPPSKFAVTPESVTTSFVFRGHTDVITAVVWKFGGSLVASASDDGTVQVWSPWPPMNGQVQLKYTGMGGKVKALCWLSDNKHLVVVGNKVQIVNVANGQVVLTFTKNTGTQLTVAQSFDSNYIACAGEGGLVYVWNLTTGNLVSSHMVGSAGGAVTSVDWDSVNTMPRLAACATDGTVESWDALTGGNVVPYKVGSVVNTVMWIGAFSPGNTLLGFACGDQSVQVWNAASATLSSRYASPDRIVMAALSSSKSPYISAGLENGTIPIWRVYDGSEIYTYTGHTDRVTAIDWAFAPGQMVASGSADKTVRIWSPPLM